MTRVSRFEVSAWLQGRLDALNAASVGGWFDEVERTPAKEVGGNEGWWRRVYARGAELFDDFGGIRSVTVAYYGQAPDGTRLNILKWRARRPGDGDHL